MNFISLTSPRPPFTTSTSVLSTRQYLVGNKSCISAQSVFHQNAKLSLFRRSQYSGKQSWKYYVHILHFKSSTEAKISSSVRQNVHKVCASRRRRRAHFDTDSYVLIEPGKDEEFVSKEELMIRLKFWLENWSGSALPPDLVKLNTIDEAVSHLVSSGCELEIDGEVGSVQWYAVRLEGDVD